MARHYTDLASADQITDAATELMTEIRNVSDIVYPQHIQIVSTRDYMVSCQLGSHQELEEWQYPVNSSVLGHPDQATAIDVHLSGAMMKIDLMPFTAPDTYRGLWEGMDGRSEPMLTMMAAVLWEDRSRTFRDKMGLSLKMFAGLDASRVKMVEVDSTTRESAVAALDAYQSGVPLSWALEMITGSGFRVVKNNWIGRI